MNNLFLGFIIFVAILLRFWQLGNVPISPNWDEVALGYDAYSLLLTGKDEYGKFLPVVLQSFDDYKPALYSYLAIPSVLLLGLNTIAVRLPSAIFGVIGVIATYLLVKTLFENYKHKEPLALIASFLMAISPWSIQFSRVAFESNVGNVLNILTALFFVKGLKKPWLLSVSALCAALSIYVYQSEKVFTPLLVLILVGVYASKLFSLQRKYLVAAFVVGIVVVAPMAFNILTDESTLLRARGTSIFSKQTELLDQNIKRLEADKSSGDIVGSVLDNRRIVYFTHVVNGYISHFDLNWLFIRGDIGRHHAPNMGLLYLFELPLILLGIYMLIFGAFDKKTKYLLFLWFLAAPIPASITSEIPHAVRTLNFLPTWQIFGALGSIALWTWLKSMKYEVLGIKYLKLSNILYTLFFILSTFNIVYYINQYFVQMNYYTSHEWQYGYKEAVAAVAALKDDYDKVIVSDRRPLDKSYMFFLFFLKYPPQEYQKIGKTSAGGYWAKHGFDKFEFRHLEKADLSKRKTLLVGTAEEIPDGPNLIKTIYYLDGTAAIKIAKSP